MTLMGDDPLIQLREASPSRGGEAMPTLLFAPPYPSFPALCRKDTTYPWSNRLRSP